MLESWILILTEAEGEACSSLDVGLLGPFYPKEADALEVI